MCLTRTCASEPLSAAEPIWRSMLGGCVNLCAVAYGLRTSAVLAVDDPSVAHSWMGEAPDPSGLGAVERQAALGTKRAGFVSPYSCDLRVTESAFPSALRLTIPSFSLGMVRPARQGGVKEKRERECQLELARQAGTVVARRRFPSVLGHALQTESALSLFSYSSGVSVC